MLSPNDLTLIGTLGRKHGTRGEVRLQLSRSIIGADDDVPDCLFIEIDGLPVPFFIDEWRERGTESMLVKFDGVDTDAQATALTGCRAFVLTHDLDDDADGPHPWLALRGYAVHDAEGTNIGEVADVDDRNDNIILYVTVPDGREVMLPFHEDLLLATDHAARTLRMAIPEGLLTLND